MLAGSGLLPIWTEASLARKTHGLFSSWDEFELQLTCTKSETCPGKYFRTDQTR